MVLGFHLRTTQSRLLGVGALAAFAFLGGGLDPLVFTALTTGALVVLVMFKLWSVHREAVTGGPGTASVVEA
jgi:uncharacterized membrane protein